MSLILLNSSICLAVHIGVGAEVVRSSSRATSMGECFAHIGLFDGVESSESKECVTVVS